MIPADLFDSTVEIWRGVAGPWGTTYTMVGTTPALIAARSSVDVGSNTELEVVTKMHAFLPPGADLVAGDQLHWQGNVYDQDGDPIPWVRHGRTEFLELGLTLVVTA